MSGSGGAPEVGGGVTIGAPGNLEIVSATVSIGAGEVSANSLSLVTSASTISSGKVTAQGIGTNTITFTGTDTVSVYQNLLVDIAYFNTLTSVTAADDMRTFDYSVTDNNTPNGS